MGRGQRLAFLTIAAAIAVAAVLILGGGGDDEERRPAVTTDASGAATPRDEATPTPTPRPRPPLLTPGGDTEVAAREGERVRFRVRSDTADQVHVHGYDVIRDVAAGETVTVGFRADIPGVFEIELESSHQPLGRLKVQP